MFASQFEESRGSNVSDVDCQYLQVMINDDSNWKSGSKDHYPWANSGQAFKIFTNSSCCRKSSDTLSPLMKCPKILLRIFIPSPAFFLLPSKMLGGYHPASWKHTPTPGVQHMEMRKWCTRLAGISVSVGEVASAVWRAYTLASLIGSARISVILVECSANWHVHIPDPEYNYWTRLLWLFVVPLDPWWNARTLPKVSFL